MSRRDEWRRVLDLEVQRWSGMSCEELVSQLHDLQPYEVELDSKRYQVEIEILEKTDEYIHVIVAVDDGKLPAAIFPLTRTFICPKSSLEI